MRVLLLGNVNLDDYLFSLIRSVSSNSDIEFDLLTENLSRSDAPIGLGKVFSIESAHLQKGFFYWIRLFLAWIMELRRISKSSRGRYDWINLHYVSGSPVRALTLILGCWILRPKRGLLLSFWGADLNEETKRPLRKLVIGILVRVSERVQVLHPTMRKKFEEVFGSRKSISVARLGLPLGLIRPSENDQNEVRIRYGLVESKLVVVVGYSADPLQKHQYILEELTGLSKDDLSKIQLIVPLTYGSAQYAEALSSWMEEKFPLGIPITVLKNRLSDSEVMALRSLTDIQINIQAHDGLSAAIREVFYFGGVVLNGSWLPYYELRDQGIVEVKIESLSPGVLKEKIEYLLRNYVQLRESAKNNQTVIKKLYSWESNVQDWVRVYKS